jgi:adenylate kinase family enzyme
LQDRGATMERRAAMGRRAARRATPENSPWRCGIDTPMDLRRVAVVGSSCSGKTTFAASLARLLHVPHIELDEMHWRPGWIESTVGEFRAAVAVATAAERWVSDGNYGAVRDLVWARATAVIWLNYPFPTVLWRGLSRTVRRAVRREELFSGNRETLTRAFFSRDSILWWVVTTHGRRRRQYRTLFVASEYQHLCLLELKRPSEANRFLRHQERVAAAPGEMWYR